MSDILIQQFLERIRMTHQMMLKVTVKLSDKQLLWQPNEAAPSIGWHLWHVARWADRLQASFPNGLPSGRTVPDPNYGLWEAESLANAWELDISRLGILQTGSGMESEAAAQLLRADYTRIIDYARSTFDVLETVISDLSTMEIALPRESIEQFRVELGHHIPAPGMETTAAGDIALYVQHSNRHLGMMEALRGVQGLQGTATN